VYKSVGHAYMQTCKSIHVLYRGAAQAFRSRDGRMTSASNQMAHNFAGAIARVWRISSELGIKNRKHAGLRIFQAFVLSALFC